MRGILISLVLGLGLIPSAAAQRYRLDRARRALFDEAATEIGLTGSVNRTSLTGIGPVSPQIRGSAGVYLSLPVAGRLRLRPELSAAFKAVQVSRLLYPPCLPPGGCPPITERETTASTWLEAPLLAEVRFPRALGRGTAASLVVGPFLAVRLGCRRSVPVDPSQLVRCDDDGTRFRDGDAGFVLGALVARRGLGLGGRWIRSLTELVPVGAVSSYLTGGKLSVIALTLDLGIRLN